MNMQNLMREAQKMQNELLKTQKELDETQYEGSSSFVDVIINGKKQIVKLSIKERENIEKDDFDMLEDMIVVAFNDAIKKVDADKEKKLSKYQGLSGLL